MANTLSLGSGNWGAKDSLLLGYYENGGKFFPETFDVTRATSGTRVNKAGLIETPTEILSGDLVINGDFDTDSDWILDSGWSISSGKASCNGITGYITEANATLSAGKSYKMTYTVTDYTSGSVRIRCGGTSGTFRTSVGTYTEVLLYSGSTFKTNLYSSSFIGSIDNVSVIEVNQDNLARIDYLDDAKGALLTEPQSTNLIPYSEDFSNGSWNKQSGIIPTYNTTETLSPDGTYNATKFVGNGTTGVFKSGVSVSGNISRSVYLKSVSGNTTAIFKDPNAEGGATPVNLTITNEWQRFELIGDNGTSAQGLWIDDITSDGLYMWGAQLEGENAVGYNGEYATSYIPTFNGIVSRNKDEVTNGGDVNSFGSEGVLYAEIAALANDGTYRIFSINDGSRNNRVYLQYIDTSNTLGAVVKSSNTTQANMTFVLADETNFVKVGFKYKANDFALWVNGVEVATDTSGLSPIGLNNLAFNDGESNDFFGKTKNIQAFNTALSDSDLLSLTTTGSVPYWTQYSAMATTLNYTNK